ncbi:hypothetical protein Ae201684P_007762 [Aphanomyces euteiches]|uniref:Integrase catalytic domain-containing protein n=1 Tax=Aphanomyces euteiches TaxID=100861 RepID=A0A6G0W4J9_9STRA|nr:hypothetical protein Ae201684_019017 [Aphanomyces euteiches]KAH9089594.1 hypothetical protein Ae201684P_007762 [Aphanomyces euteiches]
MDAEEFILNYCNLEDLPQVGEDIVKLHEMDFRDFENALRSQEIVSIAGIRAIDELQLGTSSTQDVAVADIATPTAYEKQWDNLRESPFYDLLREFASVFPEEVPQSLPLDKGVRHEIDLVPGTKWCVTRQWPLPKDVPWVWSPECQTAFDDVKKSLVEAPILALPDFGQPFSVVCDASIRGIGCCLMQLDSSGLNRPISYQSRQLRPAERNYPVHDLELLAVKYALVKFRIYLLGSKPFVVYTDHASLRHAIRSPHISELMARWLAFFAEFNMTVEYKPGRENVLADALSRRHEDVAAELYTVTKAHSDLLNRIRQAYERDPSLKTIILALTEPTPRTSRIAQIDRYSYRDGLLLYDPAMLSVPRIAVPCDAALRTAIMSEFHDTPSAGHLGREKTYLSVARTFGGRACTKASHAMSNRVRPVSRRAWSSVSIDYIFGLPRDKRGNTGIWTCVDRASKFLVAIPVKATITAEQSARLFFDAIYCRFGFPHSIVSDRDPRFTSKFWTALFSLVGSTLNMSTSEHPESDGQSERANRVIEDILRSYTQSRRKTWSSLLPHVEFAYNTSVNASTGFTPFYVNFLRHPRLPSSLDGPNLGGGGYHWAASSHSPNWEPTGNEDVPPAGTIASVEHFINTRESVISQVQDNLALAQARQARESNKHGRKNTNVFTLQDQVLLHRSAVPQAALGNAKLRRQWCGLFPITKVVSAVSYRLRLPDEWQCHDVFYVGKLKPYKPRATPDLSSSDSTAEARYHSNDGA